MAIGPDWRKSLKQAVRLRPELRAFSGVEPLSEGLAWALKRAWIRWPFRCGSKTLRSLGP